MLLQERYLAELFYSFYFCWHWQEREKRKSIRLCQAAAVAVPRCLVEERDCGTLEDTHLQQVVYFLVVVITTKELWSLSSKVHVTRLRVKLSIIICFLFVLRQILVSIINGDAERSFASLLASAVFAAAAAQRDDGNDNRRSSLKKYLSVGYCDQWCNWLKSILKFLLKSSSFTTDWSPSLLDLHFSHWRTTSYEEKHNYSAQFYCLILALFNIINHIVHHF